MCTAHALALHCHTTLHYINLADYSTPLHFTVIALIWTHLLDSVFYCIIAFHCIYISLQLYFTIIAFHCSSISLQLHFTVAALMWHLGWPRLTLRPPLSWILTSQQLQLTLTVSVLAHFAILCEQYFSESAILNPHILYWGGVTWVQNIWEE